MTIDSRFIATIDLEEYFVDKDTGAPLAAGIVTFYSDVNRTILKPVYQLTGSPPNYSFTVLSNPCILSGVGTFQDAGGNNIVPYYFPYEGTPADSDGTVELYYITVESSGLIPQFTRQAWPPGVGSSTPNQPDEGFRNFVPNGQFLSHTDIVGTTQPPVISSSGVDTQFIAQGGFTFCHTTGGTSIFNNSFVELPADISGLNDFPRYAFNFECNLFNGSDQIRDFGIQWPNVNQFTTGDPAGTQQYTFAFEATSNDASTYIFDVRMIRYYGTGGSPSLTTDVSIGSISINPAYNTISVLIQGFPDNSGVVGTNNDDFVRIALRGPASSWSVQWTSFSLVTGAQFVDTFPTQTEADMLARGVFGWVAPPNPDASSLYLSPVLTSRGMVWDNSPVGKIYPNSYTTGFTGSIADDTNELLCDGSSYITANYSHLGIPYSRLFNKLFNTTLSIPIYGTGYDFVSTYYYNFVTNELILNTNKSGSQSNTAEGAAATGFTFTTLFSGTTSYLNCYTNESANTITAIGIAQGPVTDADPGTSGFTITQILNNSLVKQEFIVTVGSSLPAASTYFTFYVVTGGAYYVWFTIDGVGTDPTPGGTGIKIPLLSSYGASEAIGLIADGMNGYQDTRIDTIAASGMVASSYFTFHANSNTYIVWYEISGVGIPPAISGTPIKVSLTGMETDAEVAFTTLVALNSYQFATPNLKGVILRGINIGQNNIPGDPDYALRFSLNNAFDSAINGVGSYQSSQFTNHAHVYIEPTSAANVTEGSSSQIATSTNALTSYVGGSETRPFNMAVSYVIKY